VFPSVDILREWFGVDSAIFITTKDILVVGATIPLMIALNYFVTRTRWGKAMRATAQDRETAQAMGIDVERTILAHLLRGRRARRGGGLIQGHVLQHRHVVDGLPGRSARVHRRRAGRHRQHAGRRRSAAS
jgi:branched-chain amino acid transport system permease protein